MAASPLRSVPGMPDPSLSFRCLDGIRSLAEKGRFKVPFEPSSPALAGAPSFRSFAGATASRKNAKSGVSISFAEVLTRFSGLWCSPAPVLRRGFWISSESSTTGSAPTPAPSRPVRRRTANPAPAPRRLVLLSGAMMRSSSGCEQ